MSIRSSQLAAALAVSASVLATAGADSASAASGRCSAEVAYAIGTVGPDFTRSAADRVIDAPGKAARSTVHLWARNGLVNQAWCLRFNGTHAQRSVYRIESARSGLCLDASADRSHRNGTPVYMYPCHSGANQRWAAEPVDGRGYFRLRNLYDRDRRWCLSIDGRTTANGTGLRLAACGQRPWTQVWWSKRLRSG